MDLCRIRAHPTSGRVRVRVRPPPRVRVRVIGLRLGLGLGLGLHLELGLGLGPNLIDRNLGGPEPDKSGENVSQINTIHNYVVVATSAT